MRRTPASVVRNAAAATAAVALSGALLVACGSSEPEPAGNTDTTVTTKSDSGSATTKKSDGSSTTTKGSDTTTSTSKGSDTTTSTSKGGDPDDIYEMDGMEDTPTDN